MKKYSAFRLLGLSCLSLSLLLTACEKENILPIPTTPPTTGTPPGNGGAPDGGNNPGGPGTGTPPSGPTTTPPTGPVTIPPSTGAGNLLTEFGGSKYAYDAQGRLSNYRYVSTGGGFEVVYEGEKILKLIHNDVYNTGKNFITYYTYTGDKVTSTVQYNGYNEVAYRHQFEYSGNRLVKETRISFYSNPLGFMTVNDYSYDSNGNLTSIASKGSSTGNAADLVQGTTIYFGNYDNAPDPKPYVTSGDVYLPGVKLFRNNYGMRQTSSSKEMYSYTYSNTTGLPVQRSMYLEGYGNHRPDVINYSYR